MHEAFRAVRRNKGKAGVDRVSIEMFAQHLDRNPERLMVQALRGGRGGVYSRLDYAELRAPFDRVDALRAVLGCPPKLRTAAVYLRR